MATPQIVWLRRDLRLADNPALYHAAQAGPIIAVYVLDDQAARSHAYGGASRWWLHHSLASLGQRLEQRGLRLILRRGDAVEELCKLAQEAGAKTIHANRHYEPWWRKAHKALRERLELRLYDANYLLPPGALTTGAGTPYKIYTPFSRATLAQLPPRAVWPEPAQWLAPAHWPTSDRLEDWQLLPSKPDWAGGLRDYWQVGERAAQQRLGEWRGALGGYDQARNLPSLEGTSHLSPHLHFGEISPVQVWHDLQDHQTQYQHGQDRPSQNHPSQNLQNEGWQVFEKQLIWRDYAQNILVQCPDYAATNYRQDFDQFPWRDPQSDAKAAQDLAAWQEGRTGYPIVDAGMRQLWQTGWMHNRVRMIAASFLVKHLLIDWRIGEQWFWDTLVDADLANNAANWQWIAGSGMDANMFVRIMAPLVQSAKFDASAYIRQYVESLAGLSDADIHDPPDGARGDYPAKIIGHREARERALAAYPRMKA